MSLGDEIRNDIREEVEDALKDVREMQREQKKRRDGVFHLNIGLGSSGGRGFWGALLILGGVAWIADQLGYLSFEGFSFWGVVWTVFFAAALIDGIAKLKVGRILFSVAFLIIVNDELLGLEAITPWPVLGAALLITIGIKMIFPRLGHRSSFVTVNGVPYKKDERISEESRDGNRISYGNAFGECVKYVSGEIEAVTIENAFGSTQVYFTDAQPVEGKLRINAENAFGSVTLYIPDTWKVMIGTRECVFGSVKEKGRCAADGSNQVVVDAETAFGGIEIRYI